MTAAVSGTGPLPGRAPAPFCVTPALARTCALLDQPAPDPIPGQLDLEHTVTDLATVDATSTYRRYHHDPDPAIGTTTALPNLTPVEVAQLIRAHLHTYPTLRNIRATPYGELTLLQGNRHITLTPGMGIHPKLLTPRQADDLLLIAQVGRRAHIVLLPERGPAINAGFHRIPPAAAERLIRRGWVATTGKDGAEVTVSVAGTVALTWRTCKTLRVPDDQWAEQMAEAVVDLFATP